MSAPERPEYVYLIGSKENTLVKIGRSVDVARRLAKIQCMSPVRLSVLWQVEGDTELETGLHRLFRLYRCHGEWFDFAGHDPVAVVENAVMFGLYEALPEAAEPDAPLASGDVVRITPAWGGPRYGVIRAVQMKRGTGEITGYKVGPPGRPPTVNCSFRPAELRLLSGPHVQPDTEKLRDLWERYTGKPIDWMASGSGPTGPAR